MAPKKEQHTNMRLCNENVENNLERYSNILNVDTVCEERTPNTTGTTTERLWCNKADAQFC